jgi:DNA-binding MarR family transcriptional regulator
VNDELERDVTDFWMLAFKIVLDGEKRLTAQLAAHSLTPPQFYVLKTLVESGGQCPIGQIARQHQLTNATMTGLVKRLEAMSPPLVSRETSADDRRSVMVSLTPAGRFDWADSGGVAAGQPLGTAGFNPLSVALCEPVGGTISAGITG